jgi:hypothetical protein
MKALAAPPLLVPPVVLYHAQDDMVGTPFYLMERVKGKRGEHEQYVFTWEGPTTNATASPRSTRRPTRSAGGRGLDPGPRAPSRRTTLLRVANG